MTNPPRKLAFILASTEHGAMIVNRFDEYRRPDNSGFGVGFQLLENAVYDPADVTLLLMLLDRAAAATATASSPSIAAPISACTASNGRDP